MKSLVSTLLEGEIPAGWTIERLRDVAHVQLGRQRSPKNHSGPHMRQYLRAANVTWDGLSIDDVMEMNFDPEEFERYRLRSGDLLLAEGSGTREEVGKPALWRDELSDCCFQNTLVRVRPRAEVDRIYLKYLFWYEARSGNFGAASRGVNIHHIGARTLSEWPILLPPRGEQRRIVAAIEEQLSRLDAAEESLARAEDGIRRLREWCMAIPYDAEWPWTTLGEVADVVGGVTKDRKRQGPDLIEVPYLRVANVQRGFLDLSEVATIRVNPDRARALTLQPGDLLLNEGGDRDKLGRGWVWSGEVPDCIHQNHVFRARLAANFAPRFVSWHANTYGRAWFQTRGSQTTNLASISRTNLRALPVPAPPLELQESIAAEIDKRLSIVSAVETETREARRRGNAVRRACLREAFAGRLVPRDSRSDSDEKVKEE